MKAIIFGGSGFLGSHICEKLIKKKVKVIVFDKKQPYQKDVDYINGDILNKQEVNKAIKNVDCVFHCAALSDIDEVIEKPLKSAEINIIGTINILEAMKKNKTKKIIYASTIYNYGDNGSFYRCSKVAAESYIQEYYRTNKINYTIIRYGSLYGPRCQENNGLYKIVKKALIEKKLEYDGSRETLREYLHVDDAASATVNCINKKFDNQNIILAGDQLISVEDVLKTIAEILKMKKKIIFKRETNKGHYIRTPYNFNFLPEKKIRLEQTVDLAQGLVELMNQIKKN